MSSALPSSVPSSDPQVSPCADVPPITTRFTLGDTITAEQRRFLDVYGFVHFTGVATPEEVEMLRREQARLERTWIDEDRRYVHGVPLFYGHAEEGRVAIQRLTFASVFSEGIRDFVHDDRFIPIRGLVGPDARVGDSEKDGVVMNRFVNVPGSIYPRLGWHTDGLRDLFYLRRPQPMLNFGVHLDRIREGDGGLRIIPGSHHWSFMKMAFAKPYFVWHRPDPREVMVETEPGDLTIHDGRTWHRVAKSTVPGAVRRSMYVPFIAGPYEPKDDDSPTLFYHRLGQLLRRLKGGR